MKLFRVRFTTENDMTPFGEVPEILESAGLLGMELFFSSGGWNKGDTGVCYHEWKSAGDPETIRNFLESRYGNSFVELCIQEISEVSGSVHPPE
jgi:hypothetical protein